MISEAILDIKTKLQSIPEFNQRISATAGGRGIDPTLSTVSLPAAWIVYVGSTNITSATEGCPPEVLLNLVVKTIIPYTSEDEMLTTYYPILEKVINTIAGTKGPVGSHKWSFDSDTIDELTGNRLVFDQRFTLRCFLV